MILRSSDGKIRILSLSYGKDSMACLGAIEQLGWPLDGIVTAEVWATQDIPADLPPMVEFKAKADAIIKERWGFEVKHCCAMRGGEKLTYEDIFYRPIKNPKVRRGGWAASTDSQQRDARGATANSKYRPFEKQNGTYGFPYTAVGGWCHRLKDEALRISDVSRGGNWCTALKQRALQDGQRGPANTARANSSEQELRIPSNQRKLVQQLSQATSFRMTANNEAVRKISLSAILA